VKLARLRNLCALAALTCGLLYATGGAQAATWGPGRVAAWGCNGVTTRVCETSDFYIGVIDAAAGTNHNLGLNVGGEGIFDWGCVVGADYGQCMPPSGLSGIVAVAAGDVHSLALKSDGSVVAWGCGAPYNFGQCSVPAGLTGITAIAAGTSLSLALKNDGTVLSWGCQGDDYGQCAVPPGLSDVIAISAGDVHSLALRKDGSVVAWGCGAPYDHGQCNVPTGLTGVASVSAGTSQSLAAKSDGSVVAWGCKGDDLGQCKVPSDLSGVIAVSAGDAHSLALRRDGTVTAWGCGAPYDYGQCAVPSGLPPIAGISAGVVHSLVRFKRDQTVSFFRSPPSTVRLGQSSDVNVIVSASSKLAGSFGAVGTCVVAATTTGPVLGTTQASVHFTGAGSCTITASQPGDQNFNAAPSVSGTITVLKAKQTIDFRPLPKATFGDPDFAVTAFASSGLPVSFAATGPCSVSNSTVHVVSGGTCIVTASQPGNADYEAAPDNSQTLEIAKADQAIWFDLPARVKFGDRDVTLNATASSGLPVTFAATGQCTISGSSLHITGAGVCTVTASQAGDANYRTADDIPVTVEIVKAAQTINFRLPRKRRLQPRNFKVTASASSGLPVSFSAHGKCIVHGAWVHLLGPGSCTLTAVQHGNANYKAAHLSRTFFIVRR
jgi:Regulator of chromosome condensation (RCC1) repeat